MKPLSAVLPRRSLVVLCAGLIGGAMTPAVVRAQTSLCETPGVVCDLTTGFEAPDTSGAFTLGSPPATATFVNGFAQTFSDPKLVRHGEHSWMIAAGETGTITLETPARRVELYFRDEDETVQSMLTLFDEDDQVIGAPIDGRTIGWREIRIDAPQGIKKITLENRAEGGVFQAPWTALDDFSFELALPHELRFAHFAEGLDKLFSQIVVFNLDGENSVVRLLLKNDDGEELVVDLNEAQIEGRLLTTIPGNGLRRFKTDGLGALSVGSVVVCSSRPISGVILFGGLVGLAGVGSSEALPDGFSAPMQTREITNVPTLNTGIAVANLDTFSTTLTLTLRDSDGVVVASAERELPAMGHLALFATELDWEPDVDLRQFEGVLDVEATGPIAATVLQSRLDQFATMPVSPPPPVPQAPAGSIASEPQQEGVHELRFAQFAEGLGQLFSEILLYNLGDGEATVRIDLKDDAGAPLVVDLAGDEVDGSAIFVIPAHGFRRLETDGEGELVVGSVTATSDQPIAGVIVFGGTVGLAGVGDSIALDEGFTAPVETNTAGLINTGIAMMNLEEEPVTVGLTLFDNDGVELAKAQLVLAGRGHVAMFLDEADKVVWSAAVDFSAFEGTVRATADGRIAATVLQLRPNQFATMPVAGQ